MTGGFMKAISGLMLILGGMPWACVASAAAADATEVSLEEIVVTAEKRAENLQEVPIAISTISGNVLEQAGSEKHRRSC